MTAISPDSFGATCTVGQSASPFDSKVAGRPYHNSRSGDSSYFPSVAGNMAPSGDAIPPRSAFASLPATMTPGQDRPRAEPSYFDRPHLRLRASAPLDTPSPLNLSNSLSPTIPATAFGSNSKTGGYFHPNRATLSPPATWDIGGASLARSVSADASIPPQGPSRVFAGLGGHSSLVENWRLERSNLDSLRRRAELLYRDQQAIIEEMSEEWLREKDEMSGLIHDLRERVQRLEGENSVLKSIASHHSTIPGLPSPHNSLRSGSRDTSADGNMSPSPISMAVSNRSAAAAFSSLPPGLESASRRPHYIAKPAAASQPAHGPPQDHAAQGPLSPRTEPQNSSSKDILHSTSPDAKADVSIIDIHEIDPNLEGIPIKAPAVQRSTFEPTPIQINEVAASPSPPKNKQDIEEPAAQSPETALRPKPRTDRRISALSPLTPAKDQTRRILATDESRRLTMHAGHTPNHSLSLIPTMTATESSSAAARSQDTTPTAWASSSFAEHPDDTDMSDHSEGKLPMHKQQADDDGPEYQVDGAADAIGDGYLEPKDDLRLKGPLMIKNIPAQDELFWAQLNQKLDPISRGGEDSLPRVLRSALLDAFEEPPEAEPEQSEETKASSEDRVNDDGEPSNDAPSNVEPDVPLKLRSTSNFGAPFGAAP